MYRWNTGKKNQILINNAISNHSEFLDQLSKLYNPDAEYIHSAKSITLQESIAYFFIDDEWNTHLTRYSRTSNRV